MSKVRKTLFIIAIIIISGASGIIANRYMFPYLATTKFFAKHDFFKKAMESVTIINKTEQVYVKEDTSINKIANQVTSSVVGITSFVKNSSTKKGQFVTPQVQIKNGTGVIATSDGLILTYSNAIFLQNASYKIITRDNNIYDATLLSVDSYSNLAFLKIEAGNLPAISFGNSDEAIPGEKIIAIGNNAETYNPFFATGVLSSFNYRYNLSEKNIASSEKLEGVFETEINCEEGCVGGPIIDYAGQAIGLTGLSKKDGEDFFFQIPSNKIKLVINKEIKKEIANNATLGVYYLSITKVYALINNLPAQSGVLIYSPSLQEGLAIIANSPAANAGLKLNDIIIAVAGEKIEETKTLSDLLYKHQKGEQIELTILRNSQEMQIKIQL